MDEKYFLNEMYSAVLERTIKRLWILCLVLIIMLFGTNFAWLYYEKQFEDVTESTTIEEDVSEGGSAFGFIGDGNEVDYGTYKD